MTSRVVTSCVCVCDDVCSSDVQMGIILLQLTCMMREGTVDQSGLSSVVFFPLQPCSSCVLILSFFLFINDEDRTNDRSTINRKLTESLFLVVKRNRKDNAWQFPQGKWNEGETMREVRTVVMLCCGGDSAS